MAENIWARGKLKSVFYPAGSRANGERRYMPAPFDVLIWASVSNGEEDTWVVPASIEALDAKSLNRSDLRDSQNWMEFGYYDAEPMIIEEHLSNGANNLLGLHGFGYL